MSAGKFDCKAIEREERARAAANEAALAFGDFIAWAEVRKFDTTTEGLSPVHRVGLPKGNVAYTTCEQPIPEPVRWFPLSAALTETMTRCGFCEANYAAHNANSAAHQRGIAA